MTLIYPEPELEHNDEELIEPLCCWLCPDAATKKCAKCLLPEQEKAELEYATAQNP